jgi:hypothetical protein
VNDVLFYYYVQGGLLDIEAFLERQLDTGVRPDTPTLFEQTE